jgi:hypothetical protein
MTADTLSSSDTNNAGLGASPNQTKAVVIQRRMDYITERYYDRIFSFANMNINLKFETLKFSLEVSKLTL